jgi:hypothetical protein
MRPSFEEINSKLKDILAKYEQTKAQQIKLAEMETLFEESLSHEVNQPSLHQTQPLKLNMTLANNSSLGLNLGNFNEQLSIKSNSNSISNLMKSSLNKLDTILKTDTLLSNQSINGAKAASLLNPSFMLNSSSKASLLNPKRATRQSESEDSQYFSGTDTSLLYAEGSSFSTASSSNYSNYSVPSTAAAVKDASLMAASLAQTPPSPPPLKSSSKLLNLATAACQL